MFQCSSKELQIFQFPIFPPNVHLTPFELFHRKLSEITVQRLEVSRGTRAMANFAAIGGVHGSSGN